MATKEAMTTREAAAVAHEAAGAEVARIRTAITEAEDIARDATASVNALADKRERLLALGTDAQAAEAVRQKVAHEAARVNEANAKLRGLHRLLPEAEARVGPLAVAVAESWRDEYDKALIETSARLDARGVDAAAVAEWVDVFRERFWLLQELHRCTSDIRHAPGSFDLRAPLEQRGLLALAPAFVQFRNTSKPALRAAWATPTLVAGLEAFRVARESAARAAVIAGHQKRESEARPRA